MARKTPAKTTATKTAGVTVGTPRTKQATKAKTSSKKTGSPSRTNGSPGKAARTPANGTAVPAPAQRLAPGELRGQVLSYLTKHPKDEFTPVQIQKALDAKSSGAVTVALERLVVLGNAKQTSDKPKRWQLVPKTKRAKR